MTASLHSLMQSQLDKLGYSLTEIATQMDYPSATLEKGIERLQQVFSSEDLGLTAGNYDFQYSSVEFIHALCAVLTIDAAIYEPLLDTLVADAYQHNHAKAPEVIAEINFTDSYQPSFQQGMALSKFRNVKLPEECRLLERSEQSTLIRRCIQSHLAEYQGKIPFDGVITGYRIIRKDQDDQEYIDLASL